MPGKVLAIIFIVLKIQVRYSQYNKTYMMLKHEAMSLVGLLRQFYTL